MRWKRKKMNNFVSKLINYSEEMNQDIETVEEETGYNFTEVQRMINDYFFSDYKNLDEVFGEAEDVEDDEEE